jgi:hypothetical protein
MSTPQPELDVLRGRAEIVVRAEQDQIVLQTELDEHRVDGSDLNAVPATRVADYGGFDVVFTVWLQESERGEPLDQLATCFGPRKALQELLQHQTRREDLVCSLETVLKRLDFRYRHLGVAVEGEGPDAGIDEQAHGLRERSAL